MRKNRPVHSLQPYQYQSPHIPLAAIRRFARQIAERFHPQKIVLFGSYAYGQPHEESDVDLLVVMPANDVVNQAIRISSASDRPFLFDLIVRTPQQVERALQQNNWFLREVMEKGVVVYDARNGAMGPVRRGGSASRNGPRQKRAAATKRGVLPLPAIGGKVSQGTAARSRSRRAKNP